MQLNKFTDYALRILMYVALERDQPYTIVELADCLAISEHHAKKIVHFMAKHHWIVTSRGKGGGIRLAKQSLSLPLGQIVQLLEGQPAIVECQHPPCILRHHCGLKILLDQALNQFYQVLNKHTLADVLPASRQVNLKSSAIDLLNIT